MWITNSTEKLTKLDMINVIKNKHTAKETGKSPATIKDSGLGSEEAATMTISDAARDSWNKGKIVDSDKQPKDSMEAYAELVQGLKQAKEAGDAAADSFKTMAKCIAIAMRIVQGDNVPSSDIQFLAENDPDLFSMAINMRIVKEDPEDWKSVLEDDEENTEQITTDAPPSVEAAESTSGTGEPE